VVGGTIKYAPAYFCVVTQHDGRATIEQLSLKTLPGRAKPLWNAYRKAHASWLAAKTDWSRTMRGSRYPVPAPLKPRFRRLAKVPEGSSPRARLSEAYQRRVNVWDVYAVTDHAGARRLDVLRRDEVFVKRVELAKAYAQAATTRLPSPGPDARLVKPSLRRTRTGFTRRASAEAYVDRRTQR
jgi:hypothetical protein